MSDSTTGCREGDQHATLPLTRAQRGVVDALALWPDSSAYMLAETVDLWGDVDGQAWADAVRHMVRCTSAQRIVLVRRESEVVQRIAGPDEVPVRVVDVSGADDVEHEIDRLIEEDRREWSVSPFDAVTTAHIVFVIDVGHVRWYHRTHHVSLDGYGFALCAKTVADIYRGHTPSSDDYRQLIDQDRVYQDSDKMEADQQWWHHQIGDHLPSSLGNHGAAQGIPQRSGRIVPEWSRPPAGDFSYSELVIAGVALHTARRTRRDRVTVGIPMMNRMGSIAARVPSMVLNVIALQIDIDESATVTELVTSVRRGLAQASRRGQYRHEDLRRELGRLGSGRPLCGPMVNVMPFDYDLDLPGVRVRAQNISAGPVEDISFQVYLRASGAEIFADANPGRYEPKEGVAHAEAVIATVAQMAADPGMTVGEVMRTDRVVSIPAAASAPRVDDVIREWARSDPQAVALRCGPLVLTRGELEARVDERVAMRSGGVSAGDVVFVDCGDRVSDIIDMLAIGRCGAAYVAVPQGDSDVRDAIVTQKWTQDGGYLVVTSGTSGARKAIGVPGTAMDCFVADVISHYGWSETDAVAALAPLHADTSIEEIFGTLCAGATVVVPVEAGIYDPGAVLDLIRDAQVSVVDLPTSLWHELVPHVEDGGAPACLRQIVIGGEEVSQSLLRRWEVACDIEVINSYGPSETTVVNVAGRAASTNSAALGTPLPHSGTLVRVDAGDPQHTCSGDTAVGELVIYGPIVADGYVGRESASFGEVTVAGQRYRSYSTGDLVSVGGDGVMNFVERLDDLVKIGGSRVRLRTIEDALMDVRGVSAAMVVRSGPYALTGFVVGQPDRSELNRHLASSLPPAWIPSRIEYVAQLPRNANVKIDRRVDGVAQRDSSMLGVVRDVISGVLGTCPPDDGDIFAHGVTSMQSVAIAGRLQHRLGRPVRVDVVLELATIDAIAAHLSTSSESEFDLAAEFAALGVAEFPGATRRPTSTAILLTGATGFVGRLILGELLESGSEVVATVRAADDGSAARRLERVAPVSDAVRSGQLRVTASALSEVMADRSIEFGAVLHCAARISAAASYSELRSDNVELAAVVTRGAAARGTPLVFVSTATSSKSDGSLAAPSQMPTGYARTKCVIELMLAEVSKRCELPVRVVRLPRVLPEESTGPNADDFLYLLGRASVACGAVPQTSAREPVVGVGAAANVLAREVAALAKDPGAQGFGIADLWSTDVAVTEVLAADSGAPAVPLPQWRQRVVDVADGEIADGDRAGALLWADLLLGGFDRSWDSEFRVAVDAPTAAESARALGIAALWSGVRA